MFKAKVLSRTITIMAIVAMALSSISPAFAVGPNDNFANATQITILPFSTTTDNIGATFEAGEPTPTCSGGFTPSTVWYAYTPSTNLSLTARSSYYSFPPVVAVYTGTFGNLTQIACGNFYPNITFQAQAGVTYYFQLDSYYPGYQGNIPFSLEATPPPTAGTCFWPSDPSTFDTMQFNDCSSDPGGVGFQSFTWDFGDGTTLTNTNCCVSHQYIADGDYTFQHTVTTFDGRTGSTSQVIHVRTKDIAITSFSPPQTARVNQTKVINVNIQNKRYSDYVQVVLIKGLPGGGEQQIGTLTIYVPAKAKQATTFKFSYTFTADDATVGKVTFKAIANIVNGRDVLPADNTAIATTTVSK